MTKEITVDSDSSRDIKTAEEFLKSIVKSSNRKKIQVHFKFKNVNIEYREWLTYKQYHALRTITCVEFCKIIT